MNEYKRKLRSYTKQIISMNSIENLSDELFYEIFDYLGGCDIYHAFSNLNYRFRKLLNSSLNRFKIKFHSNCDKVFNNFCEQMKYINKHQIYSLELGFVCRMNVFFTFYNIDSSFDHLESLTIGLTRPDCLIGALSKLNSLARLSSLTIDISDSLQDLADIYRIIFTLSKLKYFNFSIMNGHSTNSLPMNMNNNQQYSPIEHLVIRHTCTFEEFSMLTSYTPRLSHLNITQPIKHYRYINNLIPITLPYLTHLSIEIGDLNFDQFEILMSKINTKIKSLSLNTFNDDMTYLDDYRWENFILKYVPQLEKFHLQCNELVDIDIDDDEDHYLLPIEERNKFSSIFWTERQWIYEVKIDYEFLIYSIRPYKKQWHDHSSIDLSRSARLIVEDIFFYMSEDLLNFNMYRVLAPKLIHHLELSKKAIFIGTLIQIVDILPQLHSLKIDSLSFDQSKDLFQRENDIVFSSNDRKQLTSIYLNKMMNMKDIYFLMEYLRYMKYLKIDYLNNIDVKLVIRNILKKIRSEDDYNLQSLHLTVPLVDDQMIKKLDKMIRSNKLLMNYTIKRVVDTIYLEWKN